MFILMTVFFVSCQNEEEMPYSPDFDIYLPSDDAIVFTHISDIHGFDKTLNVSLEMNKRSDVDFMLMTGDNMLSDNMKRNILKSEKPVLIIPGNHDSYDQSSEYGQRLLLDDIIKKSEATYADHTHNYWYKDFTKKNRKLRVIGIDQYQFQTMEFDTTGCHYDIMMSQAQVDWFIKCLKDASEYDGIVVALHAGLGNKRFCPRDTMYVNDFVSIHAQHFKHTYDYNGDSDPRLISDIVKAYITGQNIVGKEYASGCRGINIRVTTDFDKPSDNFISFYGGHLHWDVVEKVPQYDLLQCLIAYGGWGKGSRTMDDLIRNTKSSDSYVINVNIVDFENKTLKIKRCGANVKDDGTTRDSICYNWKEKVLITNY